MTTTANDNAALVAAVEDDGGGGMSDMGRLTKEQHKEWMDAIMERVMTGDTSEFVTDVGYLKGRLRAAEVSEAALRTENARLREFVASVAETSPPPEVEVWWGMKYRELAEQARALLAALAEGGE